MNLVSNAVATFDLPEEFAKELSRCLTRSSIKRSLLTELVGVDSVKAEVIENELIVLEDQISALKDKVSKEHVPAEYRDVKYSWAYDGYAVSGVTVTIYHT